VEFSQLRRLATAARSTVERGESGVAQEAGFPVNDANPGVQPKQRRLWMTAALAALVALALASSLTSLGNSFTYDDVLIVRDNEPVHRLADAAVHFVQGYWPNQYGGALYRPLTLVSFSLQWAAGEGAPVMFHAVSVAAYAALTLLIFWLALSIVPPVAAWVCAALFAVHPVHVEAVGNIVGQAELMTAAWVCLGVGLYIRVRRLPDIRARDSVALFVILLAGALFKEQGVLLPALLALTELLLVEDSRMPKERLRILMPTAALLVVGVGIVLVLRRMALGEVTGEYPLAALGSLGFRGRLVTMLGIAPEWYRLLLWPAHLQAEYGPPAFDAAKAFGVRQALGVVLIGATVWAAWHFRRRRPVVTFGLGWAALTLLPVSNLLVPTGIFAAERTLLLPSVGAMLAIAALLPAVSAAPARRRVVATGVAALLVAGAVRSALRQPVWRDNPTIILQTLKDAPGTYRAWYDYGMLMHQKGRLDDARSALMHAVQLYGRDARVYEQLGQVSWHQSGCHAAVPYFRQAVALDPNQVKSRAKLYICLMQAKDSTAAREVARTGAIRGDYWLRLVWVRDWKGEVPPQ
jgi:tetratricopeptide (TPR) repeat protein